VTSPGGLVVDANGDVWTPARGNNRTFVELLNNLYTSYSLQKPITTINTNGAGICVSFNTLYELTYPITGAGSGLTVYNLSTQAVTASLSPDLNAATMNGCAVDSAGNVWIPDAGYYHGIEVFNSSGNLVHSYPINSSLTPQDIAIDGLGNAFVVAYNSNTRPESIVELTSTGTLVSPAMGYSPTTGSTNTAGTALVGLTNVITNTPGSAAIDSSGNLWLAGTNDLTTLPSYVTEVVGIAAPVRIPKSIALSSGQLGNRP
jgi:sugar lactone lactonase YvrE